MNQFYVERLKRFKYLVPLLFVSWHLQVIFSRAIKYEKELCPVSVSHRILIVRRRCEDNVQCVE